MTALAEDGRIRVMFKKRGINQPSQDQLQIKKNPEKLLNTWIIHNDNATIAKADRKKTIICPIEQQYSKKTKREMGKSIQEWNE